MQGGCIAVTQPRRVAAISVACRVAQEMHVTLGAQVMIKALYTNCELPSP